MFNGAFGVDVRNEDGLIVVSDMTTGFWVFRMEGFQGWKGEDWGMPNISSAQDWKNRPRLRRKSMRLLLALFVVAASASAAERPSSPWSVPFGFGGAVCSRTTYFRGFHGSSRSSVELLRDRDGADEACSGDRQRRGGSAKLPFRARLTAWPWHHPALTWSTLRWALRRIKKPKKGFLIAWATKDDLSETTRLGVLDERLPRLG